MQAIRRSVVLCLIYLGACQSARRPAVSPSPEDVVARTAFENVFVRGIGDRDTAAAYRSLAPELLVHIRGDTLRVPRAQFGAVIQQMTVPFPDIRFTVDRVVAEGNWAAAGLTFTGTHRGTWHGIAATDRHVTVTETFICRLEAQQLRECWQQWDEAGLREQLGGAQ